MQHEPNNNAKINRLFSALLRQKRNTYNATILWMIAKNPNIENCNSKRLVSLCRVGYINYFIFRTCVSTKGRLREDWRGLPSARTLLLSAEQMIHALMKDVKHN